MANSKSLKSTVIQVLQLLVIYIYIYKILIFSQETINIVQINKYIKLDLGNEWK